VADAYAALGGTAPEGLPLVADGVRAARITDAVMASASTGTWTDVVA
jgi:predicted dehydrogenase